MPRWLIHPSGRFGTICLGTRVKMATLVTVAAVTMNGLAPAPARAQTAPTPLSGPITLEEPLFPVVPRDERESTAGPSFPELFRSIGHDFASFPNRQNAMWLFVGGGVSGLSHGADNELTAYLSTSGAVNALEPGRVIGGALAQVGGAFATYGIGRLTKSHTVTAVGADLVRAQVLTQGITQAIKFTAGRTRPDGTSRSFPSGHTASAFATGTVLQQQFGWKVGIPAYGLATYVAGSRLSENRHYLSDVIFGATLGVLAGRHVTLRFGTSRFALTPQAVPGGAGIALVQIGR